jgi:hypothetical protein
VRVHADCSTNRFAVVVFASSLLLSATELAPPPAPTTTVAPAVAPELAPAATGGK